MRVSLGWAAAVVYVGFSPAAMEALQRDHPEKIRIRWEELQAWAAGVEEAPPEEREARLAEGLDFFRSRVL